MTARLIRIQKLIESGQPPMAVAALLGFRVESVQSGEAVIEFDVKEEHANTMGTLHGGVICTIADTAMGVAFYTMLEDEESLATLEMKINFLKPVWTGKLLAKGRVVKKGKSTGFVECNVTDENDQLVAHANSTYMVLSGDQATNRQVPA